MQHNGYTMNGEKDPDKRKEKLRERIRHLREQMKVMDDQIDIMKQEIHQIDVMDYLETLENLQVPRADPKVIWMARMAKVDYKSEKIPVSVTPALKLQIEEDAALLGITAPALFRQLYLFWKEKRFKILEEM